MAIFSKADNFDLHNSLKLSFTNIQGLRSNFLDYESSASDKAKLFAKSFSKNSHS